MAVRKPLVLVSGSPRQLPDGDTVEGAGAVGWTEVTSSTAATAGQKLLLNPDLGGDPLWNNVTMLLHGDGEHDSTTIVDEKQNTIGVVGGAKITTAVKVFGTGSIHIPLGGYLTVPTSVGEIGSGAFSIQMRVQRITPTATYPALISKGSASSLGNEVWTLEGTAAGAVKFFAFNYSYVTPIVASADGALPVGTSVAVEVSKIGGTTYLLIDGTVVASSTQAYTVSAGGSMYIGTGWYEPAARVAPGYYDEIRMTVGAGRNDETYTLETEPFPTVAGASGMEIQLPPDPSATDTVDFWTGNFADALVNGNGKPINNRSGTPYRLNRRYQRSQAVFDGASWRLS